MQKKCYKATIILRSTEDTRAAYNPAPEVEHLSNLEKAHAWIEEQTREVINTFPSYDSAAAAIRKEGQWWKFYDLSDRRMLHISIQQILIR